MTSLPSFSCDEQETAKRLLATTVALMMGRKFEEADWSAVYCQAKGIPEQTWSNVHIDVMHEGLGVEQKMLCLPDGKSLLSYAGTSLMHPSATRSIRIASTDVDADTAMREVFAQYSDLIAARSGRVAQNSTDSTADMRIGWLLWERSLTEFLYFEEPMIAPNPDDFWAAWDVKAARGSRKSSKNLWIYEKASGKKRYSVTTSAGIKIQPYFDVPPPGDSNLVYFRVQGEEVGADAVRIWLSAATTRELRMTLGLGDDRPLDSATISSVIMEASSSATSAEVDVDDTANLAVPVEVTKQAYALLVSAWEGVSDEHRVQLLVQTLRAR